MDAVGRSGQSDRELYVHSRNIKISRTVGLRDPEGYTHSITSKASSSRAFKDWWGFVCATVGIYAVSGKKREESR